MIHRMIHPFQQRPVQEIFIPWGFGLSDYPVGGGVVDDISNHDIAYHSVGSVERIARIEPEILNVSCQSRKWIRITSGLFCWFGYIFPQFENLEAGRIRNKNGCFMSHYCSEEVLHTTWSFPSSHGGYPLEQSSISNDGIFPEKFTSDFGVAPRNPPLVP